MRLHMGIHFVSSQLKPPDDVCIHAHTCILFILVSTLYIHIHGVDTYVYTIHPGHATYSNSSACSLSRIVATYGKRKIMRQANVAKYRRPDNSDRARSKSIIQFITHLRLLRKAHSSAEMRIVHHVVSEAPYLKRYMSEERIRATRRMTSWPKHTLNTIATKY